MHKDVLLLMLIKFLTLTLKFCDAEVNEHIWGNTKNLFTIKCRLLETMKTYFEQSQRRVDRVNNMRFMYEESPHYEMGYILGEIIERYRKAVDLTKHVHYHKEHLTSKYLRIEYTQKLYLEVYHLVQMMHEIPRKYEYMPEFKSIFTNIDHEELVRTQRKWESAQKQKERARQKMIKMYKQLSETYAKSKAHEYAVKQSPPNKNWPRDYGWEIDPSRLRT